VDSVFRLPLFLKTKHIQGFCFHFKLFFQGHNFSFHVPKIHVSQNKIKTYRTDFTFSESSFSKKSILSLFN
jgi:hypothetical protein